MQLLVHVGPHPIGTERFATVSSGPPFAQVAGAILGKRARVQNPDKDEGEVARTGEPSGKLIPGAGMKDWQVHNALVGAWRLLSWENRAADGQVTYPMGTDALGSLLYTADGRFSVMISRSGRTLFATGDLLSGTTEEQAHAVEGFVGYAGRYSFHGDRVVHHVELSLFPNWVGSDQERSVQLAGDRLTLSANPLLLGGKQQVPRLIWERVDPFPGTG